MAAVLVLRVRPAAVTGLHRVEEAPLHHVPTPDNMTSSPLVAALDPRVDERAVHNQMQNGDTPPPAPPTDDRPESSQPDK